MRHGAAPAAGVIVIGIGLFAWATLFDRDSEIAAQRLRLEIACERLGDFKKAMFGINSPERALYAISSGSIPRPLSDASHAACVGLTPEQRAVLP